jgi:hypothetical protein
MPHVMLCVIIILRESNNQPPSPSMLTGQLGFPGFRVGHVHGVAIALLKLVAIV